MAHGIFSWGMWDLVPWPRIELGTPWLGVQSLSLWTTREVPSFVFFTEGTLGVEFSSVSELVIDWTVNYWLVFLEDASELLERRTFVLNMKPYSSPCRSSFLALETEQESLIITRALIAFPSWGQRMFSLWAKCPITPVMKGMNSFTGILSFFFAFCGSWCHL